MDKLKRIAILIIVAVIVILIFATLFFAVTGNSKAFTACAWSIVAIPCFLYAMLLMYKVLSRKK